MTIFGHIMKDTMAIFEDCPVCTSQEWPSEVRNSLAALSNVQTFNCAVLTLFFPTQPDSSAHGRTTAMAAALLENVLGFCHAVASAPMSPPRRPWNF
jgi:hypothetical protein